MTSSDTSPVTRQTSAYVRDKGLRAVIVTVRGSFLELRPKGLRTTETIDIAAVWGQALRARLAHEKAERAKARKAKRSAK